MATSPVPDARPTDLWDRAFAVGVGLKGIVGIVELVGGSLLLLATPDRIGRLLALLTSRELTEDPVDLLTARVAHASSLDSATLRFAAAYLIVHGLAKVVLVWAVLRERPWAYPAMMLLLGSFITFQTFRLTTRPTVGMLLLTVFDIALLLLTWREYHQRKRPIRAGWLRRAGEGGGTAWQSRS